jgi:hypothetical protein
MKMKSCELCASFFSLRTLCTLVIQRHSDLFWAFSSLVLLNSNIQIPPRSAAFRHTKFANRSPLSHIRPLFQSVLLFPCLFIVVGNSDRGGFYTSLFLCPSSGDNTAQNCIFPISGFLVYRLCFSCFIREGNNQGRVRFRGGEVLPGKQCILQGFFVYWFRFPRRKGFLLILIPTLRYQG